ncbi:hypothetical protein M569_00111 [Genlisea aurea]|uniref:Uncharacterized protein n=1 Tax=Genlisea aurea TaxID=192259 RepID=S8EP16_9LAMI|nr:hypothetical protein M569_00111 [Genlisea aurea]
MSASTKEDAREIEQRLSIPPSLTRNSSVALGMQSMHSEIWRIKAARIPEGKNHQHVSHRGCQTIVEKTDDAYAGGRTYYAKSFGKVSLSKSGGEGAFTGGEGSPFGFICYNRVGGLDRALALPSESESSSSADSEAAFQAYLANTIEERTATPEGLLFSQIRLLENGGFYNLPPQNAPDEYASIVRLHLSQAINQNHFWEILNREFFELSVLQRRGLIETKLYQLMASEPQLARILEYALSHNIRLEADSFIQERLAPVLDQRTPLERYVLDNQLNSFIRDLTENRRASAIYRNFYSYFIDEDFRRRLGLPLP